MIRTTLVRRVVAPGAIAVLLLTIAVMAATSVSRNDGRFVYAQDDPYIHLTMARTLAVSGTWGISPAEFGPASSSPLWTLLLAAFAVLGATSVWWPFVLNGVAAALVLWELDRFWATRLAPRWRFAALLGFAFVVPLPTLVFVGMEHTFHVACSIALCIAVVNKWSRSAPDAWWPAGGLLAILVTGFRYEGMFLVAVLAAMLAIRRRARTTASIVIGGAMPPLIYAAYAVAHGAPALPNSLLMKSGPERFRSLGSLFRSFAERGAGFESSIPFVLLALLFVSMLLVMLYGHNAGGFWPSSAPICMAFAIVVALHLWLVRGTWFFRYEAYVVAIGYLAVVSAATELHDLLQKNAGRMHHVRLNLLLASLGVVALPLITRGAEGVMLTTRATHEVFLQQHQMGLFFNRFYGSDDPIALNDIGAVSWLSDAPIVDLIGLASMELADARRTGAANTAFYDGISRKRHVVVACVYEDYFQGARSLPRSWQRVGEWRIQHRTAIGGDAVTFLAVNSHEAARLRDALDRFAAELPEGVSYVRLGANENDSPISQR